MNSFRLAILLACALSLPGADYSTYIGDLYPNSIAAMAVDKSGNTFVAGSRNITVPPSGTVATDVFVAKIDAAGNVTRVATLSGKGSDQANAIAVDGSGNIYVAGMTTSPDFPLLNPLQSLPGGMAASNGTGFLAKLSANGGLLYSTYLGGTAGRSSLNALAVDAQGNAYVTGETFAPDYPHTPGLPNGSVFPNAAGAVSAAFFAKISAAGDKILYAGGVSALAHACGAGSTCFLSTISTAGVAIALDPAGNAYIGGNTYGLGLQATAGPADGIGGFVMQVNAAGSGLGYLTFLGEANYLPGSEAPAAAPGTLVNSIAADAAGNAYLTGGTSDPKFPVTTGAFQSKPSFSIPANSLVASPDAFVAKLNPQGTGMVWATFLGGVNPDAGTQITLDAAGDVWVTGTTQSSDFPATVGVPGAGEFLAELKPDGTALTFAARFPTNTTAAAMAVDASGAIHTAGATGLASTLTPSKLSAPRLFGVANAAGGALSGRIAPSEVISLYGLNFGVKTPVATAFNGAGLLPANAGGLQVTIDGVLAPLLYVSDTQIDAVAPRGLAVNAAASLVIAVNGTAMPVFRAEIDRAIPAVFAGVLNQDGSINSAANPAPPGSIVSVWATGLGAAPGSDGQQATAAQTCSCSVIVTEPFSAVAAAVPAVYAGSAPGLVNGVTQINFPVSAGPAAQEAVFLTVGIGGPQSDAFTVYIRK